MKVVSSSNCSDRIFSSTRVRSAEASPEVPMLKAAHMCFRLAVELARDDAGKAVVVVS